jgi:hypothetical protein
VASPFSSAKGIVHPVKVEYAVEMISNADHGVHYLIIYPDMVTLREFYSYYTQKQIEERDEVAHIAPFYETEDSVRQALSEGHRSIDVKKLEREGSLIISDSLMIYFAGDAGNLKSSLERFKKLVEHAKEIGRKGYSILEDGGSFPFKGRMHDLIEHELFLPSHFDMDMKAMCLYHEMDFGRISNEERQKLVEHHGMALRIEAN